MSTSPDFFTKMRAAFAGEVSASTLEAYRRASLVVLDLLDQAERTRLDASVDGKTPWTIGPATQIELACTWNAFVLQTLGNAILDADYRDNPATVGFVPPVTADQVLRFYASVEGWVNRAQQAHVNPSYKLDIALPAPLPLWSEVEPCPNSHLHGMLDAMRAIGEHAQAAMNVVNDARGLTEDQEKQRGEIRGVFALAQSKARYAEQMHGVAEPTVDIHERIEDHVKAAIESFYLLGQYAALPQTIGRVTLSPIPGSSGGPRHMPLPDSPDFDPWCLTDALARKQYARDKKAKRSVERFWQYDPDPKKTLLIQAEIVAAFERGDIVYATNGSGTRLGFFFCCPWGSIYSAARAVTIGGVRIAPLQQFVFDVTAEGVNLGAPFRRQIRIARFQSTENFEYGDPDEAPDH